MATTKTLDEQIEEAHELLSQASEPELCKEEVIEFFRQSESVSEEVARIVVLDVFGE